MGLIVDTCEFVTLERNGSFPSDLIDRYGRSELYAISVVTIVELRHGVRRADSPRRMAERQQFLDIVMDNFAVFPVDAKLALRIGDLDATLQSVGKKRELADLIVAATAIELDYSVATLNVKHFDGIPGVRIASPIQ